MAVGLIQQVQINDGDINNIASTAYGICNTSANAAAKTTTISGFELITGTTIYVKFTNNNTAESPTLNVSGTGEKNIVLPNGNNSGINDETDGWASESILILTYDGTNWVRSGVQNTNTTYSLLTAEDVEAGTSLVAKTINAKILKDAINDGLATLDLSNLNANITVAGREWGLGDTITRMELLEDLKLDNALHFIGKVANNSVYTPSDGTNGSPTISGLNDYTPIAGDVIIDKQNSREYVYTKANAWELLGQDPLSDIYSVSLNNYYRITNITQNTDHTISVQTAEIGILPISYGGTGTNEVSFGKNQVVITDNPQGSTVTSFQSRAYINNTSATAITTNDSFITQNTVYYGLPKFNNLHNYTSDTEFFVPTEEGTRYQLLVSGGYYSESTRYYEPKWTPAATLESHISDDTTEEFTILTLGNNVNKSTIGNSTGSIVLYSEGTAAHIIEGVNINTTNIIHYLQNNEGYLTQSELPGAVGSNTQPVYINASGYITALTYTPHRLYYSGAAVSNQDYTNSFIAGNYYADGTNLGIGITSWPQINNTPIDDILYINGKAAITGRLYVHDTTVASSTEQIGSIITTGGILINKNLYVEQAAILNDTLSVANNIYINETIPASSLDRYELYINGQTLHTDNVLFAPLIAAGTSAKLTWSGANNSAAIYYKIPTNDTGRLIIETVKGGTNTECLLGFSDGTNTTVYLNSDSSSNNTNVSFYPNTTNTGSLGLSTNRWKTLYIGNADTYGDEYTPIYWNNGIPTQAVIVNKYTFSFASGATSITPITQSHTNKEKTIVTAIIVDTGISYLKAPIVWEINSSGNIALTTGTATSGIVSGYILTSTGA